MGHEYGNNTVIDEDTDEMGGKWTLSISVFLEFMFLDGTNYQENAPVKIYITKFVSRLCWMERVSARMGKPVIIELL